MGKTKHSVHICRQRGVDLIALRLSFLKDSKMASFKFVLLSVAIFAFSELARADDDPEATKCYAYKTGAFATQGGSTEPGPQEKNCGQKKLLLRCNEEATRRSGITCSTSSIRR